MLIAEDELVSRRRLQAQLTKWGYQVVVAKDGLEAWDALQGPDGPSLAIIDWVMPGLDGVELCRRVRAQAREPYVYVVLLTERGRREDLIEGLGAGADDYVTKPVDMQELEVRVRSGVRIVNLHSELLSSREAMWFQASHDALTGAWNRHAAADALLREVARSEREAAAFSVAIADLDHFKQVNDSYGHLTGDHVLKESVRRMNLALRPYDVLARYGGEEFLLILPGCDAVEGHAIAERVRDVLTCGGIEIQGSTLPVTCSIGISTFEPGATAEVLVKSADEALYVAKRTGRDRVVVAPSTRARARIGADGAAEVDVKLAS